ncbi:MAG: hypothetical protein JNK37_02415 [Verrucomicrobiales bacterium]|nr:hypothetical protein [Verrucomicrobiales bacterium]
MKRNSYWMIGAGAVAAALTGMTLPPLAAQDNGLPAREALDYLGRQFGDERVNWIVEMRGYDGVPEPEEWEIFVYDPDSRYLVREYWAGKGEATNEGAATDFFPDRSPFGYFRSADLKLGSKAAFTIAEGEARKARMGFDRLNYFLRCREFSREPIWTLELVDAGGNLVGKVYISGDNGDVLRTVWIYRGSRGRPDGGPLVLDSAAPQAGGGGSDGMRQQTTGSGPALRKFDPAGEPDPLSPPATGTGPGAPPMPALPPRPELEPEPAPTATGRPEVPKGTDTRIPPPPSAPGSDTRIPPPPLPPAP